MPGSARTPATYADAGVSIDRGDELVRRIGPLATSTDRPGTLGGIGGFGALFDLKAAGFRDPVLVSGTDGVGTKLKLAIETGRHEGIGVDLVAMCVNDLLVQGAQPLFFLDYFASARLDVDVAEQVLRGVARGCRQAGCALVGGETAEMPGVYQPGDYDLAGFAVGAVERDRIIDGTAIAAGDRIIALASSGPHSNGYSLIRRLLADSGTPLDTLLGDAVLADLLLEPTRIYVPSVLGLLGQVPVNGLAHITGGGITENLPRVLPEGVVAQVDCGSWTWPEIFHWLQDNGDVETAEMYRTFNCGVGMLVVVAAEAVDTAIALLAAAGETAWQCGTIAARRGDEPRVVLVPS